MRCSQLWITRRAIGATLLLSAVGSVFAAGVGDFPLLKAIPADASIVVASRDHDGLSFVNAQYERVWQALERARLDREFKRMLKKGMGAGVDPDEFENTWLQISDLLAGVEWGALAEREMALGVKFAIETEVVLLARPPADRVEASYRGLVGLARKLAEMTPELEVRDGGAGDTQMCELVSPSMPLVGLRLAQCKDVLMIGLGSSLPARSLQMLEGDAGESIVSNARFKQALTQLPPPADGLMFVDVAQVMAQVRAVINQTLVPMAAASDPNDPALKMPGRLLDLVDLFDHLASVSSTQGKQRVSEARLVLRDGAKSKPLYGVLFGRPPLKDPLRYVPADAGNVAVNSGVDLLKLYRLAVGFARDSGPMGAAQAQAFEAQLQAMNLDVEKDLLGWLTGGVAYYTVPGPTQFSPGQWSLMFEVSDPNRAAQVVDRVVGAIEQPIADQDGRISSTVVGGEHRFRVIQVPMLAMLSLQPAIGVTDDWLVIASSVKTVEQSLKAAADGPTFASNPRFQKEGLPLSGDVVAMSFTDTSKLGESWSQALQMAPMIGFAAPEVAQDPTVGALLQIARRLGPVALELNFFQSDCSVTTFNDQVLHYKTVNNYQDPPKPKSAGPVGEANAPSGATD